ncbi:LacI family DNA-binding transcriptional regulator, partial [Klebsiella pneumoniae]
MATIKDVARLAGVS